MDEDESMSSVTGETEVSNIESNSNMGGCRLDYKYYITH